MTVFDMPPESAGFPARGAWVVAQLGTALGLKDFQAAAFPGNFGAESHMLAVQEISPIAGRGGFGWPQWTGGRRVAYEEWCAHHYFTGEDDEANYGYVLVELKGAYRNTVDAVRRTTTLYDATFSVGQTYERPYGTTPTHLPGMAARYSYAKQALGHDPATDLHLKRMLVEQTALQNLGLYTGALDGLWGPASRAALAAFQRETS